MVESVMLLNDEDCHKKTKRQKKKKPLTFPFWNAHEMSPLLNYTISAFSLVMKPTLSSLATFCLRRRRLCLRIS